MRAAKSIVLMIVFTIPFLFADLYTKYLAHTELPNEGDQIVLVEPLYAISPMINYGSVFGTELEKENASHFIHLIFIPIIILCALAAYHAVSYGIFRIHYFMVFGGALGNGIEIALFSGVTDFLNTNTGSPYFDMFVFNLADVFILIPVLFWLIPAIYLFLNYICEYYIYDKLLLPILKKIGVVYTPPPPKYSEELTLEVVDRYKSGETLEEIASAVNKTPNSIRGKLVSEGVYTEYKEINFRLSQMSNPNLEHLILKEGMECSFEDTLQYLHDAGYLRVSRVTQEGCYSVRGGVIQLHPFGSKESITLDYFGDQIETIKVRNKKRVQATVKIKPYTINNSYGV